MGIFLEITKHESYCKHFYRTTLRTFELLTSVMINLLCTGVDQTEAKLVNFKKHPPADNVVKVLENIVVLNIINFSSTKNLASLNYNMFQLR